MREGRALLIVLVIVLAGFTIYVGYTNHQRRKYREQLAGLVHTGRYDIYDQQIQERALTRLFPVFSLAMMKLNALISNGENERIDAQFQHMDTFDLTVREGQDLYQKGFYYYLKQRNKERCAYYLEKAMDVLRDPHEKAKMEELYQIFLCQNTVLEEDVCLRMEGKSEMECYREEYLLAQIYENKQDPLQAELYRTKAYRHKHQMEEAIEALRFDRRRKHNRRINDG